MNFYLKILLCLTSLIFISIYCEVPSVDSNLDIGILSQVFRDIINEFLLKEGIKFNILTFSYITQFQKDVMTDFMLKSNEEFDWKLNFYNLDRQERGYID